MMRLFSLLMLLTAAAAFTVQPWGTSIKTKSASARFMFSADDKAKELPTVEKLAEESMSMEEESAVSKNIVKDMNTGEIKEVKWVDPAMSANTNVSAFVTGILHPHALQILVG